MELVAIGHNCVDYLARVPSMIDFDENGPLTDLVIGCGGQATTAMVAAQRLGARTSVIGAIGDDEPGAFVVEALRREGVRTDLMRVVPGAKSQVAIVLIDERDGRRAIFARHGPDVEPALTDADRARIAVAKVLHLDGHLARLSVEAARFARQHDVVVTLDASSVRPGIHELIGLTDYLITSAKLPARFFPDVDDCDEAARRFLRMGPKVVVTTFGEKGSRTWTDSESFERPAFDVDVVDTTGAGDVFHGAYAYGLGRGWELSHVTDFASACAAMKCRSLGGQPGIPTLSEVCDFLKQRGNSDDGSAA